MAKLSINELSAKLAEQQARWTPVENRITKLNVTVRKRMLGADLQQAVKVLPQARATFESFSYPQSIDWRNNNGNHVTPVKSQGGCGSCVSFGSVAVLESMASIEKSQVLDLSEADSHFCSSHGASCDGWWPEQAFNEIQNRGVCDEACFPYPTAFPENDTWQGPPSCNVGGDRESRLFKISTITPLNSDAEAKQYIAQTGPVTCCFDVYDDFYYHGAGVYHHVTGDFVGGHCVQVIGYSDIDGCWICKNSWDTDWGDGGFFQIAYGECNIDTYQKYGVSGVILPAIHGWHQFDLSPANMVAGNGGIAAVSRIPGSMEVFWIAPDGSVQDAYWYDNVGWNNFTLAPAGSASVNGSITAVSRIPGSMEVFWIGADGSIQDAYWYDNAGWNGFTLAPAGSAALDGGISVVSRIPGSMEVFWIGGDGSIQDAYWYDTSGWNRFTLGGAGSASVNGGITAVSRIPGSMEVFWITPDGSVQDAYWYDSSGWNGFMLASSWRASTSGSITAVSRIQGSMEVFWIGADGSVQDAYWYDNAGWNGFTLAPAGSADLNGSISVVSRIPGSMEVFWTGADGSIQDAYWYDSAGWNGFTLAPAGSASPGGELKVVSRIPDSMEVWYCGADGSIKDAFWYP